jgi:hypothetical protein
VLCQNISDDASSYSDVVPLRHNLEVIRFCVQHTMGMKSPYRRSRRTQRDFSSVRLPSQGVTIRDVVGDIYFHVSSN